MRARRHRLLPFVVLWAVTVFSASAAWADGFSGKVVGVTDGDTITALRDRTPVKFRLHGLDIAKLLPGAICGHSRKRCSETVGRCGESRCLPGPDLGNTPENGRSQESSRPDWEADSSTELPVGEWPSLRWHLVTASLVPGLDLEQDGRPSHLEAWDELRLHEHHQAAATLDRGGLAGD
jgi:hypothetical protein